MKMYDNVRWHEKNDKDENSTLYTILPFHVNHEVSTVNQNASLNFMETHRIKCNSDNSFVRNLTTKCSKEAESLNHHKNVSFRIITLFALYTALLLVKSVNCDELDTVEGRGHFTHTWAVHIQGGETVAKKVAEEHGMHFRGKIIDDHYHFEHKSLVKRSLEPSHSHQTRMNSDSRIVWSKQQKRKIRRKRDYTRLKPQKTSSLALLNDPSWPKMWYLNRGGGFDMNVIPVWREGITGKGIVVTILDDGLELDHPDLQQNYDPNASWDFNSHDADPMPHYDLTDSNRHGTRCAGEVSAVANNSLCSVGIAFNSKIGGVRMLDGDVTDAVEAQSLALNPQHIDIYSASWGPDDDGKTVDGPGELATKAFVDGVTKGRGGKGSIFIWASGNGGREQDDCNCDGYTNSIWTLSISSATENGEIPWYSERCSSTLATTYSSGQQNEKQVLTTDLHHQCTSSHTGTSASAPLAAGIVALVLEANPNLTWRDMQHIVVRTANPANLGRLQTEWQVNGVGRKYSHNFGYGLLDAMKMVRLAQRWETVPEQMKCEIFSPHLDKPVPPRKNVTFTLKVDHCKGVNYLEHTQAQLSLTTQRRGDIQIFLTSPAGTRSNLLSERVHDISRSGFNAWPFMSVHFWGESPQGTWQLEIQNKGRFMGQITQWNMIFHGTFTEIPSQQTDTIPPINNKKKTVNEEVHNSQNSLETEYFVQTQTQTFTELHTDEVDKKSNSTCRLYSDNQLCLEYITEDGSNSTWFLNQRTYIFKILIVVLFLSFCLIAFNKIRNSCFYRNYLKERNNFSEVSYAILPEIS